MEDRSFIDLLKDKNFERIIIDSRLEDSFKRVMKKIQSYFNANGYTSERDYSKFLEEFLLSGQKKKLQILANDEPPKIGAAGFYRHRGEDTQVICIDESLLKRSNEYLDSVLCHEFIHFLVMRALQPNNSDPQIRNGGFINEALTEMLTQQIYPNSKAYAPQVNMMKFVNLLTDKVNNYSQFLRGNIDARGGASCWKDFVNLVTEYQTKMKGKPFIMREAAVDQSYVQAQQYIIQANIHPHLIKTFQEYEKWIDILNQRPAPDNVWIEHFKVQMDQNFIRNLGVRDQVLQDLLASYLKEYRDIDSELSKYEGKDVIEFEIAGRKIAMDENRRLYGAGSYSTSWNPSAGIYKIQIGNESREFNINDIDFSKRKQDLLEKKKEIPKYFSKSLSSDIKAVNNVAQTDGLIKLQRFELPSVGSTKNSYVYVATYKDRIEVIDSAMQLGNIENINAAKYMGLTALENGAIYANPAGTIEKGIVISELNQKRLQLEATKYLKNQLRSNLSEVQLSTIVEQYRKSNDYDAEDENDIEQLKDLALTYYAKKSFQSLSDKEKKDIFNKIAEEHPKFMISSKDGKIDVSVLFGKEHTIAFLGQSKTLFDENGKGLWNEYYSELRKKQANTQKNESYNQKINIDGNGNIIYQSPNISRDSEKKQSNPREELNKLNAQMDSLRQQYGIVTAQIESLMKQNQQATNTNYQQQLQALMQKRNSISEQMAMISSSQKTYQTIINNERETHHKAVISQVEKLLSTHITSTAEFVYDSNLKVPRAVRKDTSSLRKEQRAINQRLEELFYDGQLDLKTYQVMRIEIGREFDKLVAKAPKPPVRDDSTFKQAQEKVPIGQQPAQQKLHEEYDDFISALRKKYDYDNMSEDEKEEFDRKLKQKSMDSKSLPVNSKKKGQLEEQRRSLRRKQFEERAKAMGLDIEQIANLDNLFAQQEIIEQMSKENGQFEEVENHGMQM